MWKQEMINKSFTPPLHISVLISIIVGLSFIFIFVQRRSRTSPPLPPGPLGLPILGYGPFLKQNQIHTQFTNLASTYGPIYKFWAGAQLHVVVNSPSLAKQVLRDNESIFSQRKMPAAAVATCYDGSDLACLPMGPEWVSMKKVLTREIMSDSSLDRVYPLRRSAVVAAMRELVVAGGLEIGKPVDVFELAFKMVVDATVNMVWGGELGPDDDRGDRYGVGEVSKKIMKLVGRPNVSDAFPVLSRFDLQGIKREAMMMNQRVDGIISSVIQTRLEYNSSKITSWKEGKIKDMLQILMENRDNSDSRSSLNSIIHFKALIQDIIMSGNDSTSIMIEWAMTELLRSKNSMQKVMQELDQTVGLNNLVEDHHLRNLHYLDAVVKETCRMHLALAVRTSNQSCTIGGYSIPKGTNVHVNAWAIHRDPEVWDQPTEFRPERFLERENNGKRFDYMGSNSSFRFIPFGSGRRVCAGVNMAERLLKYVLASLLHTFEWKLVDQEEEIDLVDEFTIFIKKKNKLALVPKFRLSSTKLLA
ncbi:3,9-dihydroxypterocarpan 6A-monooxygenase [Linum grandiflorum]